jgi:hypothetical protein
MDLKPQSYNVAKADIDRVQRLGYIVTTSSPTETFIKKHFANFDLATLLEEVERSFTMTTALPISRQLIIREVPPFLRIIYKNAYTGEDDAVVFEREFLKIGKAIIVKHLYCIIPKLIGIKGLSKKYFKPVCNNMLIWVLRKSQFTLDCQGVVTFGPDMVLWR